MTIYVIISWVCGAILVVDGMRRPESQWIRADRDRDFWVWVGAVISFFGLGPFILLAYLIAVVPLFSRSPDQSQGNQDIDDSFRKR